MFGGIRSSLNTASDCESSSGSEWKDLRTAKEGVYYSCPLTVARMILTVYHSHIDDHSQKSHCPVPFAAILQEGSWRGGFQTISRQRSVVSWGYTSTKPRVMILAECSDRLWHKRTKRTIMQFIKRLAGKSVALSCLNLCVKALAIWLCLVSQGCGKRSPDFSDLMFPKMFRHNELSLLGGLSIHYLTPNQGHWSEISCDF